MNYTNDFIEYLKRATTPIQAVNTAIERLEANGFKELKMGDSWCVERGGAYFVKPYPTSLFAFKTGLTDFRQEAFRIITSHTDSPGFKIKPNPEMPTKGYLKLNTELYCQPMFYSWMDRPLSIGGHLVVKSDDLFNPTLIPVDIDEPLMTIPSLAIHYNREVNTSAVFNPQKDMLPLVTALEEQLDCEGWLNSLMADRAGCAVEDILDYDLYVYIKEEGCFIGSDLNMVSAPRVDNLASVYASIESLIESNPSTGVSLAACFDNEEIGSGTKQGADSMLLKQVLDRICIALNKVDDQLFRMYANSFMISADGAHALHPNVAEKSDPTNEPVINKGIVIKVSARQHYTTDGVSGGIFKSICDASEVPFQYLVNRSDIPGGKTLGQMVAKYAPIKGVDVGLPMLAMHSARELFGAKDFEDMIRVFRYFYDY